MHSLYFLLDFMNSLHVSLESVLRIIVCPGVSVKVAGVERRDAAFGKKISRRQDEIARLSLADILLDRLRQCGIGAVQDALRPVKAVFSPKSVPDPFPARGDFFYSLTLPSMAARPRPLPANTSTVASRHRGMGGFKP